MIVELMKYFSESGIMTTLTSRLLQEKFRFILLISAFQIEKGHLYQSSHQTIHLKTHHLKIVNLKRVNLKRVNHKKVIVFLTIQMNLMKQTGQTDQMNQAGQTDQAVDQTDQTTLNHNLMKNVHKTQEDNQVGDC